MLLQDGTPNLGGVDSVGTLLNSVMELLDPGLAALSNPH